MVSFLGSGESVASHIRNVADLGRVDMYFLARCRILGKARHGRC